MPRNSSGTYSLPTGNPVVSNTLIQSTWANTTMSDLGSSITDSLDRAGRGAMLAPLKNTDGTQVAPSMTFSSEGTLGIYRVGAGVLGFVAGGALVMSLSTAGLVYSSPLVLPLGSATVPSLTFVGNGNTGWYSPGVNQIAVTTNGIQRVGVDGTGAVTLTTGALSLGAAGANSITATDPAGSLIFRTGGLNNRMTIDASGNVGIGTVTPAQLLEVMGNFIARDSKTASTTATGRFFGGAFTGNPLTAILTSGTNTLNSVTIGGGTGQGEPASQILFATGTIGALGAGTERMRIDTAGNVGIGVTPSPWFASYKPLQIGVSGSVFSRTGNEIMGMASNAYATAANVYAYMLSGNFASLYTQSSGQHIWYTAPSGTAGNPITFSQSMTLDASGNMGLGQVSNATYRMAITATGTGVLITSPSGSPQLTTTDGNVTTYLGYTSGAGATAVSYIGPSTAHSLAFLTTNVERMRITAAGAVGIGAPPGTFVDIAVSGGMLRMGGASGNNLIQAYNSGSTLGLWAGGSSQVYSNSTLAFLVGATTSTASPTGGNTAFVIQSTGAVTFGAFLTTMVASESLRIANDSGFLSFFNAANTVRNGYIQFNTSANSVITCETQSLVIGSTPGSVVLSTGGNVRLTVNNAGVISDAVAELGWKDLPQNAPGGAYTLVIGDRGRHVYTANGVTVPSGVFSAGNIVSIVNGSGVALTVTQGAGVTLHQGGTTATGNRSLLPWGIASVLCTGANVFVINGNIA